VSTAHLLAEACLYRYPSLSNAPSSAEKPNRREQPRPRRPALPDLANRQPLIATPGAPRRPTAPPRTTLLDRNAKMEAAPPPAGAFREKPSARLRRRSRRLDTTTMRGREFPPNERPTSVAGRPEERPTSERRNGRRVSYSRCFSAEDLRPLGALLATPTAIRFSCRPFQKHGES